MIQPGLETVSKKQLAQNNIISAEPYHLLWKGRFYHQGELASPFIPEGSCFINSILLFIKT